MIDLRCAPVNSTLLPVELACVGQEDHDAVQEYARQTRRRADGDRSPGDTGPHDTWYRAWSPLIDIGHVRYSTFCGP